VNGNLETEKKAKGKEFLIHFCTTRVALKMPEEAYLVELVRTAGGRKKGALREWKSPDLLASCLDELVTRTGIDGGMVEEVICGCVDQVGQQAGNIGRMAVLASEKLPETVPGVAVDRQCGSGQQALHFAAMSVMSGVQDIVIACGVESMTNVPIGANIIDSYKAGRGQPSEANGIQKKRPGVQFSQFKGAELLAKKHGITRDEIDQAGYESQVKAHQATTNGWFKREIVPLKGVDKKGEEIVHDKDEGIRPDVSLEAMKKLKTLDPEGVITAAASSQICDGSAAILVCNKAGLQKLGLKPRAVIKNIAGTGTDPVIMLEGPIPATQSLMKKANMSNVNEADAFEVNEAFIPVPLAWAKVLGADMKKLNMGGGAAALGHPLGATGIKLMVTLVHHLERLRAEAGRDGEKKKWRGIQAICEGGGTGSATLIELCQPNAAL